MKTHNLIASDVKMVRGGNTIGAVVMLLVTTAALLLTGSGVSLLGSYYARVEMYARVALRDDWSLAHVPVSAHVGVTSSAPWAAESVTEPSLVISNEQGRQLLGVTRSISLVVLSYDGAWTKTVRGVQRKIESLIEKFGAQLVQEDIRSANADETVTAIWRVIVPAAASDELLSRLRHLSDQTSLSPSTTQVTSKLEASRSNVAPSVVPFVEFSASAEIFPRQAPQLGGASMWSVDVDELVVDTAVADARLRHCQTLYDSVANATDRVTLLPKLLAFEREAKLQRNRLETLQSQVSSTFPAVGVQIALSGSDMHWAVESRVRRLDHMWDYAIRRISAGVSFLALMAVWRIATLKRKGIPMTSESAAQLKEVLTETTN